MSISAAVPAAIATRLTSMQCMLSYKLDTTYSCMHLRIQKADSSVCRHVHQHIKQQYRSA
jgi:hypothetical protein